MTDVAILERTWLDYPGYDKAVYLALIALAHAGYNATTAATNRKRDQLIKNPAVVLLPQ